MDEFVDGELPEDLAQQFRDHLPGCERCKEVLEGRMQDGRRDWRDDRQGRRVVRSPHEVFRSLERRRVLVAQSPGRGSAALDLAEYVDRYLEFRGRGELGEAALRDLMLCVAPQRAAEEDARAEKILRRIRVDVAADRARRERAWWRRLLRAVGFGRRMPG